MKYWFYSEGNILGPYAPVELLSLPAFSQGSLVCPETSTGDNPGDWKAAEQVAEIAEVMSVGVGGIISAQSGGVGGTYELETGFSSGQSGYDAKNAPPYGYENLLNTIDNILGAYKESENPAAPKAAPDYELMDRFDIRLSKIQEDLEAARWEKNLLLEKIRAKDTEERKNRERISELEEKLKEALNKNELDEKELAQVQHLVELNDKAEALKKIADLKKEDFVDRAAKPAPVKPAPDTSEPAQPEPAKPEAAKPEPAQPEPGRAGASAQPASSAKPGIQTRSLKSMRPSQSISLERMSSAGGTEEPDDRSLTSRKLRSLGSNAPAFRVNEEEQQAEKAPAEAAPQAAPAAMEPLPQQASGIVYDFTVVTKQSSDSEKQQFKIEPKSEPAQAPQAQQAAPQPQQPAPQAAPQQPPKAQSFIGSNFDPMTISQVDKRAGVQPQNAWQASRASAQKPAFEMPVQGQPAPASTAGPAAQAPAQAASAGAPAQKGGAVPDKTERIAVAPQKQKDDAKKEAAPAKKGRGKMAFLLTMVIFSAIAAGGLGYFFLGSGSFAEFFGLNFKGGKPKSAAMSTQLEPQGSAAPSAKTQASVPGAEEAAPEAPVPQGEPQAAEPAKPAFEPASNENTSKALEIVKNYKLSGGRGSVAGWFANSFLSTTASGSNEEWNATSLHGDIFVVQYRLLRPKQDPLIYQFEVDVAKGLIVRGINNNAIDLLDFSSKVTAKAEPAKPKAKKAAPKAKKSREIPILPLPDEPAAKPAPEEPTGFETAAPEDNEKVKYIVAQESDEELF